MHFLFVHFISELNKPVPFVTRTVASIVELFLDIIFLSSLHIETNPL